MPCRGQTETPGADRYPGSDLPARSDGQLFQYLTAKAGGLADVSAALVSALFNEGADVHVALPDYRSIFHDRLAPFLAREQWAIRNVMPDDRVHLAEDRAFFYLNRVYSAYGGENTKALSGVSAGGDQQYRSPGATGPDPLQ
jgi:hypothetical protein